MKTLHKLVAAGVVVAAATAPAMAADISGAGSTFAYPIYSKWAEAYKKETGIGVNYQAIGSGDGITQIQNKEVTFAASDMPLSVVDLDTDGLLQFPTLTAGVVPVVKHRRRQARRPRSRRFDLGQDLPGLERRRDPQTQPQRKAPRPRRSGSCIVPTGRAPPSCSPIISAR